MQAGDLKDKKITLMGLGLHGGGVGTVRFLTEAGAKVIVTDLKSKEELLPSLEKLKGIKNVTYIFNQHRPEDFSGVDMVVKNPSVPWTNKYIQVALSHNIPVEMDASLFVKLTKNPIIGITGTKGKTTTCTLIAEILKKSGLSIVEVGIGQSPVLDKIKELKKESIVVFELSSWRLSALGKMKISPRVAVMTNLYPDHMNYYKSMKDYLEDKKYIYKNQKPDDFCVINYDDPEVKALENEINSNLIKVSANKIDSGRSVYVSEGSIYTNDGVDEKKIAEVSDILLRGKHNVPNVLLAIGAAGIFGAKPAAIKKVISEFKGVPHRLEIAGKINEVTYVNDTAATTPESAIYGLESFSEPVVLICGGSDKNLDMSAFGKAIAERAKAVVFLRGLATEKLIHWVQRSLEKSSLNRKFKIVDTMEKAVEEAKNEADPGDIVLLSPGAASFGLFSNEFDRGNKFKTAVKALK